MSIGIFMRRHAKGSATSVKAHERRGWEIERLIRKRFGIRDYRSWRVKHLRWVLEHGLADKAPATRYDYWRTVDVYVAAREKLKDWESHLRGPWQTKDGKMPAQNPQGGRPRLLPGIATRRAAEEAAARSATPIVWKGDP